MNRFEEYDEDLMSGVLLFWTSPVLQALSIWFEVSKLANPDGIKDIGLGILVPLATAILLYSANASQTDKIASYHKVDDQTRQLYPDDPHL